MGREKGGETYGFLPIAIEIELVFFSEEMKEHAQISYAIGKGIPIAGSKELVGYFFAFPGRKNILASLAAEVRDKLLPVLIGH